MLDHFVQDERGKKMQAILAVFKYQGQPFEDPMNLGIDAQKSMKPFYVKMPDMTGIRDTSYAYLYFGGAEGDKGLNGYVFVIIGQNYRNYKPTLMWIDRNLNLDMSDDGPPDTFPSNIYEKDI